MGISTRILFLLSLWVSLISCVSQQDNLSTRLQEFEFIDDQIAVKLPEVYECKVELDNDVVELTISDILSMDYVTSNQLNVLGIKTRDKNKIVIYKNLPNIKSDYEQYLKDSLTNTSQDKVSENFNSKGFNEIIGLMKDSSDIESYILGRIYERGKYFAPNGSTIYLRPDGVFFTTQNHAAYYANDMTYSIEYRGLKVAPCSSQLLPNPIKPIIDFTQSDFNANPEDSFLNVIDSTQFEFRRHEL